MAAAGGRLSAARAVALLACAAHGLDYAHSQGIQHGDVKPAKLLVETDGTGTDHTFVADFGTARTLATTGLAGRRTRVQS